MSIKALSDYIFYSKYAKHLPNKQKREVWKETGARVFNMHREFYADKTQDNEELIQLIDFAEKYLLQKRVLGSQRALQFGGAGILKKHERMYNCCSGYIDRPRTFQEAMFLLLCGVGVGFSVQKQHVDKLPTVANRNKEQKTHIIEDSIEGWADALGILMSSYFTKDAPFPEFQGCPVEFDYSRIRPEGAFISWGGIAPGPEGLRKALVKIEKLIERGLKDNLQTKLRPIDYYDILMHASDAVLSGGIRRSATICLFSPDDEDMLNAKVGDWFVANPQRGRSNNSAVLVRHKTSKEKFSGLFDSVKHFGEPGFVWVEDEGITVNPCVEIGMWPEIELNGKVQSGWQFCNLSEINVRKANTKEEFLEACKAASIIGTLQAGYTTFPYLGEVTEAITKREALLGVSMTGMMDHPDISFDEEIQKEGAEAVLYWNEVMANHLNINSAARATCVKPSGSASCLLGTSSGIHPQHAELYIRRVQANKLEFPVNHFKSINPDAVEDSIWSANNTDYSISFLCKVPRGAKVKNKMSAIELLEHVHLTQNTWVEHGTRHKACVKPFLRHNVSNTITVKDEEWIDVENYIFNNKSSFAGISLLAASGDKDYDQAPFTTVYTPAELVRMYGDASMFASGLIVDGLHVFDSLWKACDTVRDLGETINVKKLRERIIEAKEFEFNGIRHLDETSPDAELEQYLADTIDKLELKRDWVRRANQFADRYFDGDTKQMTYCLKDVSNWKKWVDLSREYKEIDWSGVTEESYLIKADTLAAAGCSGGRCLIDI